jgi:cold shock CspA family protein
MTIHTEGESRSDVGRAFFLNDRCARFVRCYNRPGQLFFHISEIRDGGIGDLRTGDDMKFTVREAGGGGGGGGRGGEGGKANAMGKA